MVWGSGGVGAKLRVCMSRGSAGTSSLALLCLEG